MNLSTSITDRIWTSELTDIIGRTSDEYALASVSVSGEEVYSERLYAYSGVVRLSDLCQIVEDGMRENGDTITSVTVSMTDGMGEATVAFTAIFCEGLMSMTANDFLSSRFLTTIGSKRTFRSAKEVLRWYDTASMSVQWKGVLRWGSVCRTVPLTNSAATHDGGGIYKVDASYASVRQMFGDMELEGVVNLPDGYDANGWDDVVAWTVTVGPRHMAYYLIAGEPQMQVVFRNMFNAWEYANLLCVNTKKSKTSRQSALIGRTIRQYGYDTERTVESETAPLAREEAKWLAQLFDSRDVRWLTSDAEYNMPQLLIDDCEWETSDSDTDVASLKIKWRFADQREMMKFADVARIFTAEYDLEFS